MTIHRPWRRIHLVMYLVTAAYALVVVSYLILLLPTSRYLPGGPIVTAMAAFSLALNWLAYFGTRRSAEVRDGQLRVRSWFRWGRLGTDRSYDLRKIDRAVLLRPHHVELAVPGARPGVAPYGKVPGVNNFGTFWWYDDDYRALDVALTGEGIETEYRHTPGMWWQSR